MKNVQTIVNSLISKGWTKWRIAKTLKVSWRTVLMWQKGTTTPNEENFKNLENLK